MERLSIFSVIVLFASLGCTSTHPSSIVGVWETNLVHADGTRTHIVTTFESDGTVSRVVERGPQDDRKQVDERIVDEGTWVLTEKTLVMQMSDGSTWKDEVQELDSETLFLKTVEGEDPVRRGQYAGSHRR